MRCAATSDPGEFWRWAESFVVSDPVRNNVLASVVHIRRTGVVTSPDPAAYVLVTDEAGRAVGAAIRTPPYPAVLSQLPAAAIDPLADLLWASAPDTSGVTAPTSVASAFARAWTRRSGGTGEVAREQRVHRLDVVTPPRPTTGTCRVASAADRDLLLRWHAAFYADVGEEAVDLAGTVDRRIAAGEFSVWEVDATPVAYAGRHVAVAGAVRIGPVYTPPEHRGRGYASGLVAAVSQRALDEGARACCLLTDLDNPTSNKIYAALGYYPVSDLLRYHFTPR